ncbi:MAG: hypothetical protein AAB353_00500 [Candidatus Hydrogenedentota bacterium]
MKIELPVAMEAPLRGVAESQGRDIAAVIIEALQQYIDSISITDLDPADVGQAQIAMLPEFLSIEHWEA